MFNSKILLTSILLISAGACKKQHTNDNAEVKSQRATGIIDAIAGVYRRAGVQAADKLSSGKMFRSIDGYVDENVYLKIMKDKTDDLNRVLKQKMRSFDDLLRNERIKRAQDITTSGINYGHTNGDAANRIIIDLRTGKEADPSTIITEANAHLFAFKVVMEPVELYTVVNRRLGITQINMQKLFTKRVLPQSKYVSEGTHAFSRKHLEKTFPIYLQDLREKVSKMKPGTKEYKKASEALEKYEGFVKKYGGEKYAWKGLKVEVGYVITEDGVKLFTSTDLLKTRLAYEFGLRDQHSMASQAAFRKKNGGKLVSTKDARVDGAGEFMTDYNVVNGKPQLMTMEYAVDVADIDRVNAKLNGVIEADDAVQEGATRNRYLRFTVINNKTGHHQSYTQPMVFDDGRIVKSGAAYFNCANYEKTVLLNKALGMTLAYQLFDEGTKKVYTVTFTNCATLYDDLIKGLL